MSLLFTGSKLGRYSLLNNFYNGTRFHLSLIKNKNFFFFFRYFLFPLKKLISKKQSIFFFNTKVFTSFFFSFFKTFSYFLNGSFTQPGLLSNQFYAKKNVSLLDEKDLLFFKNISSLTDLRSYSSNVSYVAMYPLEKERHYKELASLNTFSLGLHTQKTPFFYFMYPFFTDLASYSLNLFYYYFFSTLNSEYSFLSKFFFNSFLNLKKSYPNKRNRYFLLSMKS